MEIAQRIPVSHCQITVTVIYSHNFPVKLQWEIKSRKIPQSIFFIYIWQNSQLTAISIFLKVKRTEKCSHSPGLWCVWQLIERFDPKASITVTFCQLYIFLLICRATKMLLLTLSSTIRKYLMKGFICRLFIYCFVFLISVISFSLWVYFFVCFFMARWDVKKHLDSQRICRSVIKLKNIRAKQFSLSNLKSL